LGAFQENKNFTFYKHGAFYKYIYPLKYTFLPSAASAFSRNSLILSCPSLYAHAYNNQADLHTAK